MKPAPFEYLAPRTLDEVLEILGRHGDEATLLAGGQSLVPAMNFRLAQPAILVDLNRVEELSFVKKTEEGLLIGAMTRQSHVERSDLVRECDPLLFETMPFIAHPQIRNRGTIGGSLAQADPAAELPAVALSRSARFHLQGREKSRWVEATDFFRGMFATCRRPDEILVEIAFPPFAPTEGWAFEEFARRHGDYAIVGVACSLGLSKEGLCTAVRLSLLNAGESVTLSAKAPEVLLGRPPTPEAIHEASRAVAGEISPLEDLHASVSYRRHLARVLSERALTRAAARAGKSRS